MDKLTEKEKQKIIGEWLACGMGILPVESFGDGKSESLKRGEKDGTRDTVDEYPWDGSKQEDKKPYTPPNHEETAARAGKIIRSRKW